MPYLKANYCALIIGHQIIIIIYHNKYRKTTRYICIKVEGPMVKVNALKL